MSRISRLFALLGRSPLLVAVLVFAVAGTVFAVTVASRSTSAPAPRAAPDGGSVSPSAAPETESPAPQSESPSPSPSPIASAKPSPKPSPSPSKSSAKPVVRAPDVRSFAGLGTWIDLYDLNGGSPADGIAGMKSRGVKTLYLQTSRYTCPQSTICPNDGDIARPELIGEWLDRAHEAGIRVVGWYLPGYGNMERDVRRMVAVATFRSATGQRFDALAIDIESKDETGGGAAFNNAIATHLTRVRTAVGSAYPVGAIVPAPLGMAIRPESWTGFPWAEIGRSADIVLPMAYWSYRTTCGSNPSHCAGEYGKQNTSESRRLTGLPVHVIGGIGDKVTAQEVSDFVDGSRAASAYGGSLYDYRTTQSSHWAPLARYNG